MDFTAKPPYYKIPPKRTLIIMLTAFIAAAFCVLSKYLGFPWNIASILAYVMDIPFHEIGHAIAGCLLGSFSVPTPMLMAVTYDRSWTFQIFIFLLLFAGCYWLKKRRSEEAFHIGAAFTALVIILAFSGHDDFIRHYMGHGGAVLFGGFFQYRAWVFKDHSKLLKQWFFAWLGFVLILNNIRFCYGLLTSAEEKSLYKQGTVFGMDNDFTRLAALTGNSIETFATFTIFFAVIINITAFLLALTPNRKPLQLDKLL